MFDKLVVEMCFDVVGSWKIQCSGFGPHCDQGVSKCNVISQSKWL